MPRLLQYDQLVRQGITNSLVGSRIIEMFLRSEDKAVVVDLSTLAKELGCDIHDVRTACRSLQIAGILDMPGVEHWNNVGSISVSAMQLRCGVAQATLTEAEPPKKTREDKGFEELVFGSDVFRVSVRAATDGDECTGAYILNAVKNPDTGHEEDLAKNAEFGSAEEAWAWWDNRTADLRKEAKENITGEYLRAKSQIEILEAESLEKGLKRARKAEIKELLEKLRKFVTEYEARNPDTAEIDEASGG